MPENNDDLSDFEICWPVEPHPDISAPSIEIYDPADVHRLLNAEDFESSYWSTDDSSRSHEEELWRRRLRALVKHPDAARRDLLIADDAMIQRLVALKQVAPNFEPIIDLVLRAARLSYTAQSPLLLPPLLLLGAPGGGKTHFTTVLAEALGTLVERVAVDMLSDHATLTGLSLSWKAARTGRIANALLTSTSASPIVLLDEADKANPIHAFEQPLACLNTMLEPENARRYTDEYLTVPMRAEFVIWILTANSTQGLAPSVIDRLLVAEINDPTREQRAIVVKNIYERVNARYNCAFSSDLNDEVVERLLQLNPRTVRKMLESALAFAHDSGQDHLSARDVENARRLLNVDGPMMRSIGFI